MAISDIDGHTRTGGNPGQRLKEAVSVFNNTKTRTIPEMPVVVSYVAAIGAVKRKVRRDGQVIFVTSRAVEDSPIREERWEEIPLDVFGIRDEFLKARTERKALDFLRETGEFLPGGDDISWSDFQLWRDFAEQVDERETLTTILELQLSQQPTTHLDPTGKLGQMLLMLTGIYDHTYFGPPAPPLTDDDLDNIRRANLRPGDTPNQTEERFQQMVRAMKQGHQDTRQRQRELEEWFREPPARAYSIEWYTEAHDPELERKMSHGGAMIEFLRSNQKLKPLMLLKPRCTLSAVASAIYVERIAQVQVKRCPGCNSRIEIESHKGKQYCSDRCKFRIQKQRQREGTRSKPLPSDVASFATE